jgi:hypothetical protein
MRVIELRKDIGTSGDSGGGDEAGVPIGDIGDPGS